jgi:hypothetical protein
MQIPCVYLPGPAPAVSVANKTAGTQPAKLASPRPQGGVGRVGGGGVWADRHTATLARVSSTHKCYKNIIGYPEVLCNCS